MRLSGTLILVLSTALAAGGCNSKNAGHGGGGGGGGGDGGGGNGDGGGPGPTCTAGGACQMSCSGGGTTTLTGKVFAPNGTLPLYNAIVYIPSTTPAQFTEGVTCDRCNGQVSGNPIVQTLTDSSGSFTLSNVPVGANVPLVIQLGKWRRQVTLASVAGCVTTPLDAGNTSLPKNRGEGDIPKIAMVTGFADPMECLLLKIGLDADEIQDPTDANARIHFYQGANNPGLIRSNNTPDGTALYSSADTLKKYDVVMLPCEGGPYDQGPGNLKNISDYLDIGGRVFSTHYSYDWWHYNGSPYEVIGNWQPGQADHFSDAAGIQGVLDVGFPKGVAFSAWLQAANVSSKSPPGQLNILEGRHDIISIAVNHTDPKAAGYVPVQDWVNFTFDNASHNGTRDNRPGVMQLTFNTPLNATAGSDGNLQFCGRAVFSDYHVSQKSLVNQPAGDTGPSGTFPDNCKTGDLSDQEKALAFQLFDLSSCVQSDTVPPIS
jgi:hypothetical protein